MRRRIALPWLVLAAVSALLLAACGGDDEANGGGNGGGGGEALPQQASDPSWSARDIAASQEGMALTPINVNSNLGVGQTRFALGLLNDAQVPIGGATVQARFYRLAEKPEEQPDVAELVAEMPLQARSLVPSSDHVHGDGTVHKHDGDEATMYVADVTFDTEGWWGLSADVETAEGDEHKGVQVTFYVQDDTSEPSIGDPVPPSEQMTSGDVDDLTLIDSSVEPNADMHQMTVAEALANGQPFLVAFVTPAFCQSRFCGPVMEQVVTPVWEEFGDRLPVLHIEPFDLEQARQGQMQPVPATQEWGLLSEPFVFVVDAEGKVAAKFEGIIEAEEVRTAVEQVLQATPASGDTQAEPGY
ncbi:MAG: hypothetical protein GEU80_17165 [Dehalococcoidia bacterium]|nr:hypothetical protein [Dehalococcoidia bacterium]